MLTKEDNESSAVLASARRWATLLRRDWTPVMLSNGRLEAQRMAQEEATAIPISGG